MLVMDRRSAELTKYAANAMLATRISFMNDMANLCELLGADVELVRRGMGSDPRIGPKFLFPGPGFGGCCFPKDVRAAISTGREVGYKLEILDAVVAVNERQKRRLGEKILAHFGGDLKGKRIAVWGLAFKPGTDDIREAPALALIDQLLAAGATVSAHDPVAIDGRAQAARRPDRVRGAQLRRAKGADALALVTEWHEFRRPTFERLKALLRQPVIFDGRNVWSPAELRAPASPTTASAAARESTFGTARCRSRPAALASPPREGGPRGGPGRGKAALRSPLVQRRYQRLPLAEEVRPPRRGRGGRRGGRQPGDEGG